MKRFLVLFVAIVAALFALELTPPAQKWVVGPWTTLVAKASSATVQVFDKSVIASGPSLYDSGTGWGVTIQAGCNGVEAMIVLAAGMLAFPASWRQKIAGIGIGFIAVQALNLVRIISLFYLGQWNLEMFHWAHLYGWQVLIMLDVLIVWMVWINWLARQKKKVAMPVVV